MLSRFSTALIFVALLAFNTGCGDDDPTNPGPGSGPVPDFQLVDVNSTSVTFDQNVSPRQHLQEVSAWYFGSAN